ncbi:MAG: hypothetical protein H6739_19540 [Alphaproteobacteria bacterium]|nr:hypothetical protein [Alphaproteobacteria bacterium]
MAELIAKSDGAELLEKARQITKKRLADDAKQVRVDYLKNKPMGKGNVASAEVRLGDGETLRKHGTSRAKPIDKPKPKSQGGHFEPSIDSHSGRVMDTDSEYKVLSALADDLIEKYGDDAVKMKGKIHLYTEMSPCESCARVIEQFKEMFPEIKVDISWDMTYGAHSH